MDFNEALTETRLKISQQRKSKNQDHKKTQIIAAEIIRCEKLIGSFFTRGDDGNLYFFDAHAKKLFRLDNGHGGINLEFAALILLDRYGVLHNEKLGRLVYSVLAKEAMKAEVVQIKRFSYYDITNHVLYLSRFDGTCYRLDGQSITVVSNGKYVLFADDDGGITCTEPEIDNHKLLFKHLVDDISYAESTEGGLTPEEQKALLHTWLYCLPFEEFIAGKPLLLLVGEPGAGKTFGLKRIQQVLHGRQQITMLARSWSEEDLSVALMRNHIAVLDNVDGFVEWLPDALASYCTNGSWVRRKRYTDLGQTISKPRSFIAVTTHTPTSFYRADIADRSLILRFARRVTFGSERAIFETLNTLRPKLYGEWIYNMNRLVNQLKTFNQDDNTDLRMSDFSSFIKLVGTVVGVPVDTALQKIRQEQVTFSVESDSTVELIKLWLQSNNNNQDRWVNSLELFCELAEVAHERSLGFGYKTAAALTNHLKHKWNGICAVMHAEREQREQHGHRLSRYRFFCTP